MKSTSKTSYYVFSVPCQFNKQNNPKKIVFALMFLYPMQAKYTEWTEIHFLHKIENGRPTLQFGLGFFHGFGMIRFACRPVRPSVSGYAETLYTGMMTVNSGLLLCKARSVLLLVSKLPYYTAPPRLESSS